MRGILAADGVAGLLNPDPHPDPNPDPDPSPSPSPSPSPNPDPNRNPNPVQVWQASCAARRCECFGSRRRYSSSI